MILLEEIDHRCVVDDFSHASERRVQGVNQGVNTGWLTRSGDDDRSSLVVRELLGHGLDPMLGDPVHGMRPEARGDRTKIEAECCGELFCKETRVALDVARGEAQAMIRVCPRRRVGGLDDVETTHALFAGANSPAVREETRGPHHARLGLQEIGVEGDDDPRVRIVVERVDRLTEREPRAFAHVALAYARVRVEAAVRKARAHRIPEPYEGRGVRGLRQNPQFCAAIGVVLLQLLVEELAELFVRGLGGPMHRRGRAVRIVQVENRGLGESVGAATARGMIRVAFDLGRTTVMALDENAEGVAAAVDGRGVVIRDAGDHLLGRAGVGDELLDRATKAPFKTEERGHRGAELHEPASTDVGAETCVARDERGERLGRLLLHHLQRTIEREFSGFGVLQAVDRSPLLDALPKQL